MKKTCNILNLLYNTFFLHKYPISLIHFVTQRCNARCPYCFVDFKSEEEELSLEEIEKIAMSSGKTLRNVALTGGEPFIREDLTEIANIWYTNSTIKTISVTTNGSMPDRIEKFAANAVKKDIPVFFFFSYDFIEEQYSAYRKIKDLHLKVLESYKIIKSFGNKLHGNFQITINPDTYDSAIDTYQFIRDKLKIENVNIPLLRGDKEKLLTRDTRIKLANVYEKLHITRTNDFNKNILKGYKDKALTSLLLDAKNKILWKTVLKIFREQKFVLPCLSGTLLGIIYHNGDVAPCEVLKDKIANLREYDFNFMNLWNSTETKKIRNKIKASKCYCTSECSLLVSILASHKYWGNLFFEVINNWIKS